MRSRSPISPRWGGNRRQPGKPSTSSSATKCGLGWMIPTELSFGPSTDRWRQFLIALPTTRATRIDPQPFRILLCRRLHLPLPLTLRTCRCGRQLDMFAAQICREAGARLSTNVFVRDLDLAAFNVLDGRRLEVLADGLTLFRGAQLAIDTMVSPLHRDGTARRRAADVDGAALEAARRRKERTYPELYGDGGIARLVVLAAEVGGRWSTRPPSSSPPWPRHARCPFLRFCKVGSRRGSAGGVPWVSSFVGSSVALAFLLRLVVH